MRLLFRLARAFSFACLLLPFCFASPGWSRLQSANFVFDAEGDSAAAHRQFLWLQQLRTFYASPGSFAHELAKTQPPRLRVIQLASPASYATYRLNELSDAYYIGADGRGLIVLPGFGPEQNAIAAHEYAHAVLQASGWKLPPWLNEGLAEIFSTAHYDGSQWEFGTAPDSRLRTLRKHHLLPLGIFFSPQCDRAMRASRDGNDLFYAESWAVTGLLSSSPTYAPHFVEFVSSVTSGVTVPRAISAIYNKTVEDVGADLRLWLRRASFSPIRFAAAAPANVAVTIAALSPFESASTLADLLLRQGQLDRAQSAYETLAHDYPGQPGPLGALGTIALSRGNRIAAVRYWKAALDAGIGDADLCFRYAVLAEDSNLDASEVRRALSRAVALSPDFDDARYHLALLESNAGNFTEALLQLKQIRSLLRDRAYHYWSAIAYAEGELGNRKEAISAAHIALSWAKTPQERAAAQQIAYKAGTDAAVQFVRDPDGGTHLIETRIPHGTSDWNPFIQPGDQVVNLEGQLAAVQCNGGRLTGFVIATGNGTIPLLVSDPTRVLMRNGPAEFTCGPQQAKPVRVEYAANSKDESHAGLLRGMAFH